MGAQWKGRILFRAGLAAALAGTFLLAGHVASAQRQGRAARPPAAAQASAGLTAFRSDEELREFLRSLRQQRGRQAGQEPAAPSADNSAAEGFVSVTGSRTANPSITNNQEADVDEGGIVKVRGDTLVILR
ncbi:MAG TPA: hypothetical protein VES64_03225, partial [Allosphingosinicella sp.]|nr:hypothetical protein [Allosphingosinicella sp.]